MGKKELRTSIFVILNKDIKISKAGKCNCILVFVGVGMNPCPKNLEPKRPFKLLWK
jgi:hypothetical protein